MPGRRRAIPSGHPNHHSDRVEPASSRSEPRGPTPVGEEWPSRASSEETLVKSEKGSEPDEADLEPIASVTDSPAAIAHPVIQNTAVLAAKDTPPHAMPVVYFHTPCHRCAWQTAHPNGMMRRCVPGKPGSSKCAGCAKSLCLPLSEPFLARIRAVWREADRSGSHSVSNP
jgi:hypothetical protein